MRTALRTRLTRSLTVLALVMALILPAAVPVAAQNDLVLRVGTTQDLDSMNPFGTALVVGFEVFTLNYELLVGFGQDLGPVPAFASSWEQSDDGLTWTFTINPDKLWSDGEPATAEDAAWTLNQVLASVEADEYTGLGYLDPYVSNAGITSIEATDDQTLVITTDRPNTQVLGMYIPILPRHIWEDRDLGDDQNDPPVVGSGPYQAVQWQTGQRILFERNPNFDGEAGAADEVIIQIFGDGASMAESLRNNELDYAHNVNPDQFDQLGQDPNIETVAGVANGWTQLGFNTYGTGTGNVIEGGGPSTPALQDQAFRDALGYAIDNELLVDRLLNGHGEPGLTHVPPFQVDWHVPPENPRTFDLDEARSRLEAAGYTTDANNRLLDLEGNPISLRLVFPDSSEDYSAAAQFIQDWWGQLGITVTPQQYDSGALIELMLPPEAGEGYTADYDLFIWGWGGDVDPNSLLEIFTCDQIGGSSDSMYCNPEYDDLFARQNRAESDEERAELIAEMQQMIYEDAPYHILFYDAVLAAYRTDTFTGWQNQPDDGVPFFGYGPFGYSVLRAVGDEPAATPGATPVNGAPGETPAVGQPGEPGAPAAGGDNLPLILGLLALVVVAAVAIILMRRRRPAVEEE
jgi:peptide/nickel transport system substrate-binding protein